MNHPEYNYNLGLAFYSISEKYGENIALKYPGGKTYSYAELNNTSNKIARYLAKNKISKGDVVAIFNDKSFEGYALMLACLKVGAIYTNLDISSPWQRIHKILNTCNPEIIFYGSSDNLLVKEISNTFQNTKLVGLNDGNFLKEIILLSDSNLPETHYMNGGDPAYIMFTSGSTGFPKGAVMSNSNVLNFIKWGQQTFNVLPEDIFTNANPIYFDNSVFDFYTSLFSGASLVPLNSEIIKNATQIVQAINSSKCTIWFSVPSLLVYLLTTKALNRNDFLEIKRIVFGGEGFPKTKLKQLFELLGDRVTLFNVYGPTECTCICSSYIITKDDFEDMSALAPLGNIAPNFDYEIIPLENNGKPDYGELGLIGPCVGLGYYNDVERTSKSFIQNPNKKYYERLYKTGDIVEKAKNGYLYFKGRVDNQIKHMGYRIELEEIEAAFSSLPYVNEVGVVYQKVNAELGQIKAFVHVSDNRKTTTELMEEIKKLLPPYMIPKSIKIMDVLPKSRNGKIDRKQLIEIL
jgi:D-alanine--poly(phosphoribitol) ligase subunit 1